MPPNSTPSLFWFRQDLRLSDNPGLQEALAHGPVIPLYIQDTTVPKAFQWGGASRLWLHHSLSALNESLKGHLIFASGDPQHIIPELVNTHGIQGVYWNRCYGPWNVLGDKKLKETLKKQGIHCQSFNGSLLWEPWTVLKSDGAPYKVFTPFYRKGCLIAPPPVELLEAPKAPQWHKIPSPCSLEALNLLPSRDWGKTLISHWTVGEKGAQQRLAQFIGQGLPGYKEGRNFPSEHHVSRLSPHLHWGEISPHHVWHAAHEALRKDKAPAQDVDHFCSELGWREFSHSLLYHFPDLPTDNFNKKYDAFPWKAHKKWLHAWQRAQTGVPIVDAGLRELWETGYMHNRVRMIVSSFLVKNLNIHWRDGAAWFWDCLVDADLANNSASWQWVAGTGADAAPYFRIFNPVTQAARFDPEGTYIHRFCPHLKGLAPPHLFAPWEAPQEVLQKASVTLGEIYPYPMVDLIASREQALAALQTLPKDAGAE